MNSPLTSAPSRVSLMDGQAYRESLRRLKPRVFVDGRAVDSVADEPALRPGVNALAFTYDAALKPEWAPLALATQTHRNRVVSRMLHLNESAGDLLNKLEYVRLLCQETGCAQRYLAQDALNGLAQAVARIDDARGTREHRDRFEAYLAQVQDADLSLGVAMTDAKGDRSRKPHQQANPDTYVHTVSRNGRGIVISGTKAIVTGAPYMHELLVMPSRHMGPQDADFAVCCAVPVDAPGVTLVSRPAGRPGEKLEHGEALFSAKYGQATAVVIFDQVFVPWERVFFADEWEHSAVLTYSYATHHRHTCIAARAGFGDLLIGAGALMAEANGLDPGTTSSLREPMVELIKITEGFYACGVAASVYAAVDAPSGVFMPDPVFSNIGKLLLSTQIYDMHRLAHEVSGGLIVTLPGPDEDHNPATAATLAEVLRANPDVPYDKRIQTARFIEDLTASYQGGWYSVISLHGGGSPAAMKQEIWRHYPVGSKVELVERLLNRGVLHDPQRAITHNRQPGRCCDTGCTAPGQPVMVPLPSVPTSKSEPAQERPDQGRRQLLSHAVGGLLALGGATGLGLLPQPVMAQARPIRLVVPYPPGGPLDIVARALADKVRDSLGPVVVENRPGAGGNLGADLVAKAAPDGHTLVMGAVATHAINPWLYARLPYDPLRDFTPITLVAQVPNVLVLNTETADRLGLRTVADLVTYARAHPARLNYGSGGNGSAGHLAGEMFKTQAGIFAVHIPYAGAPPAQLALVSGQVDFNFDNLAAASANIRSGKLRALAVTTARRSSAMPELPTVSEAGARVGLRDFDIGTWFGLFGPARLPPETTQRLNRAFVEALQGAELQARLAGLMAEAAPSTPEQFGAFVRAELAKYERVVKASGARVE